MPSQPTKSVSQSTFTLPSDAPQRQALHNEVHARPCARIGLPALVVHIAVLNEGVSRDDERRHLNAMAAPQVVDAESLHGHFLQLDLPGAVVKWERHSEFTRYTIQVSLTQSFTGSHHESLWHMAGVPSEWISGIPGQTMAAIELLLLEGDPHDHEQTFAVAAQWLQPGMRVASVMGTTGHSVALTDFRLRSDGFERMVVIATPGTSEERAGRISQRLLEMETYRLMALRGLPVAKSLTGTINQTDSELAEITAHIERDIESDPALLHRLAVLAARVEQATAAYTYRFSATAAYHGIVKQRIGELRERPIQGIQTIGEFMTRRLSPAMATVEATANRLTSLSERVARATALLRTRVDIATEAQNQQLLEQLAKGQALQLRLQATVEGLSIAAISYYVISLILYAGKAGKALGLPIHAELLAGALIPVVLWAVWLTTQRIHKRLHSEHSSD